MDLSGRQKRMFDAGLLHGFHGRHLVGTSVARESGVLLPPSPSPSLITPSAHLYLTDAVSSTNYLDQPASLAPIYPAVSLSSFGGLPRAW